MLQALRGVRVLDLTRILAGPFGTMLLADLGADVIKIERPAGGDDTRAVGPYFQGGESLYFLGINRSKRSVCIDLTTVEGREVLAALAAVSDVLVENFRPGVAERLGCDATTMAKVNPRLIVCAMSAFGREGPDREQPAFDLTLQARGGTMGLTGEPGRMPVRMGPPMGDLAGGLYAALAISAALVERARTGRGQFIDLALLDCQVSLLTYAASFYLNAGAVLGPQGSAHAHAFPYQAFATRDRPIAVAVFTDAFWPGFCRAIGKTPWADDPRFATHALRREHVAELLPEIESTLRGDDADAWLSRFAREQVAAAPIASIDGVFAGTQLRGRRMVAEMTHPTAGNVRAAGNPMKLTGWESESHGPPPRLGEHTDQVLAECLGYDRARLSILRARGVVR